MTDKTEQTVSEEFTPEEKELLTELEEKHAAIVPFKVKGVGLVVIRRPTRAEWKRHHSLMKKPGVDEMQAEENLFKLLAAYPGPDVIDKVLDKYPGMDETFKMTINLLASGDKTEVVGSLGKEWREPGAT